MKKRLFFFAVLLLAALSVAAQSTRVAILETVDHEGKVPYGVKLMLRTNLTHAISSTEGFEGYDQIDLAALVGVKDFAQNGTITETQIKELGEKTSSAAILIAEVAQYDATQIIITAKLLNAATAAIESSAPPKVTATDPESLQGACAELMAALLSSPTSLPSPAAAVPALSDAWRTRMAKVVTNVTVRLDENTVQIGDASKPGYVLAYSTNGFLYCGEDSADPDRILAGMTIYPDGYEVAYCPGGKYYAGTSLNGVKTGVGWVFGIDGSLIYSGEFKDDKPVNDYPGDNLGTPGYIFAVEEMSGGDLYVGVLDGEFRRMGLYIWPNGDAWYGFWRDNQRNGQGIYMYYDGSYDNAIWDEGERVMSLDESNTRDKFFKRVAAVLSHAPVQYTTGGAHFGDTLNGFVMYTLDGKSTLYCGEIANGYRENEGGLYLVLGDNSFQYFPKGWVYSGAFKHSFPHDTLGCVYGRDGKVIYAGGVQSGIPLGPYPGNYPMLANMSLSAVEMEDGSMFLGELLDGVLDGLGLYIWPDDDAWFGYWDEGYMNGRGLKMNKDGSYVDGLWQKGEFVMTMEDYVRQQKEAIPWTERLADIFADIVKGEDGGVHIGDTVDGFCVHTWGVNNSSIYFGDIKNGQQNGFGMEIEINENRQVKNFPDSRVYVGEWKDGMMHDKKASVYGWDGKLKYEGKVKKNKPKKAYPMHLPYAAYTFQVLNIDGDKYIGEIFDDKVKSGYGIYIWENGDAWFGSWHGDKPVRGLYLKSTGEYYIGHWDDIP
ncbi:MAG: hypothetical protein J6X88_10050 [Bacteroidales bacterium]|nr:hypothetical protein [Bacteroidales bacterium]